MTFLKAENLVKTYVMGKEVTVKVLTGASLSIQRGEFVAIVGSSGSNKNTLLHILGGLDTPTSGHVFFNNQSVFKLKDRERDRMRCRSFGFVFQFYHLLPDLNVLENVMFPPMIRYSLRDWFSNARAVKKHCERLLEQVGLQHRLKHRPNELSGGERQRVAISRALANEPAILLADEPTGNLDKKTGQEVLRVLHRLHEAGQTIVMVTHDPEVADSVDRVLRLEDGKVRTV